MVVQGWRCWGGVRGRAYGSSPHLRWGVGLVVRKSVGGKKKRISPLRFASVEVAGEIDAVASAGKSKGRVRGVDGRWKATALGASNVASKKAASPRVGGVEIKSVEPEECREFVQGRVVAALPQLMESMEAKALKGDLAALRLLWQMAGLDEMPGPEIARKKKRDSAELRRLMQKLSKGADGGASRD